MTAGSPEVVTAAHLRDTRGGTWKFLLLSDAQVYLLAEVERDRDGDVGGMLHLSQLSRLAELFTLALSSRVPDSVEPLLPPPEETPDEPETA